MNAQRAYFKLEELIISFLPIAPMGLYRILTSNKKST